MQRKRVVAFVAVGWLAGAGLASAQSAPAFPPSLERESLLLWLQRETDITPASVVAVTPQAITAVVSTFPGGGGHHPRLVIRAEALSAETYAQTGALSWHVSVSADCAARRIRLGETTGYERRNLLGERRTLRPAEVDWRAPQRGTALELAWRAACEPDFRGPLQGESVKMANADAPPADEPEPAPVPAAPPPPPPVSERRAAEGPVVQVGAAPSEAEARRLLASIEGLASREAWVETATVGGRVWRRAVVGGFADRAEAARFCAALRGGGRDCFVRNAKRN